MFLTCVKIGFGLGLGYSLGKFCATFTETLIASVAANGLEKLADAWEEKE